MQRTRRWALAAVMAVTVGAAGVSPPAAAAGAAAQQPPPGLRITVTELADDAGRPLVSALRINDRGQVLGYLQAEGGRRLVVLHRGRATPVGPEGFVPEIGGFSDRGQVVGTRRDESAAGRAFSWADGRFEWLTSPTEHPTAAATAVNDRGQVLGLRQAPPSPSEVVVWRRGGAVSTVPTPSPVTWPMDINNRGQAVVGSTLWQVGGGVTDLGTLGGPAVGTQAAAINDRGQVAGASRTAGRAVRAFLWQDGEMTDLGTLGGDISHTVGGPTDFARTLNERGHVVGVSGTADGRRAAFLWRDGEMIELASPDHATSWPTAVNDRDQVVGYAAYGAPAMAWLWHDGRLVDLGALAGGGDVGVADINNRGQIVGSHEGRAVMWTVRPTG